MYADFHPFLWISIPVSTSSTIDPYFQPTYIAKFELTQLGISIQTFDFVVQNIILNQFS